MEIKLTDKAEIGFEKNNVVVKQDGVTINLTEDFVEKLGEYFEVVNQKLLDKLFK